MAKGLRHVVKPHVPQACEKTHTWGSSLQGLTSWAGRRVWLVWWASDSGWVS